ncbi:MAG: MFS transporter [Burkholderiaceae bacterium]|nr:MFS transporter [Burkholderiaceae bacterium]
MPRRPGRGRCPPAAGAPLSDNSRRFRRRAWPALPGAFPLPISPPDAPLRPVASTSAWAPLSLPVFRMLWLVWMTANTTMWMNDVAAAWLMSTLTPSPVMVALVQTASTLPVFLLGLGSGALADILDRRRFLVVTQFWVSGTATLLCLATLSGVIDPVLLLVLVFLNGVGLAMRWPVYSAIVPNLVPRLQLPAALALNGVAMNASRIMGPIVAGFLISGAGTEYVFVLNATLSLVAALVILRWKTEKKTSALPGERFLGAIRVGVQYVRQSDRMRSVLLHVVIFFSQSTALIALLPLLSRRIDNGAAGTFTLLLAAMGVGAIASAFVLPKVRATTTRDDLLRYGSQGQALAMAIVAFAPNLWVAVPTMMIGGAAWLIAANSLSVSAQLALPDWVRARGMSIYQVALMGGAGLGAALWGQVAAWTDVRTSIAAAAATGAALLWLTRRHSIHGGTEEDLTPQSWKAPVTRDPVAPSAGPVLTTIEYRVDPARIDEFRSVMQETRRSRLRGGVLSWELFRDTLDPDRFIEYFIDETWVEHLRRFDRFTASDIALRQRRLALHVGEAPPQVTRCIAEPLESD